MHTRNGGTQHPERELEGILSEGKTKSQNNAEDQRKEMEQGVLLQGLKELVTTITEGNKSLLHVRKREL